MLAAAVAGLRLHDPDPPAGAATGPLPPETGEARPAELDLSAIGQLARMMHEPRTVHVLVTNHGPEPVRVAEVELRTESFAPTGPVSKDVVIPAGGARALAVIYGEARCGGEAAPALAPASARLVLAEPATTVELALPGQDQELTLLLHRECAAQRVSGSVEIRFGAWTAGPDGRLQGELVLARRDGAGDEPIVLYDLAGNVLFQVIAEAAPPGRPAGTVPAGGSSLVVPVVADANRCDGHAVGEAKQRFLFRVWVSVGADENLPVAVALDPADHERFEEMLRLRCDL